MTLILRAVVLRLLRNIICLLRNISLLRIVKCACHYLNMKAWSCITNEYCKCLDISDIPFNKS